MKYLFLKSIFILSFLSFNTSLFAQIYVDMTVPTGGDGVSWTTAYRDLQTGLLNAFDGDEIWVAAGDYYIIGTPETSFEVPSGVQVFGGFDGTETLRNQRDWVNNLTILNGGFSSQTIVYFYNSSPDTKLDGFTIKNGMANGTTSRGLTGAAISIETSGTVSSPVISNCILSDNHANSNGGAVYLNGSFAGTVAPVFENCTFSNNSTLEDGGAVYGSGISGGNCNPSFIQCHFIENSSIVGGGALFLHGGDGNATATIKNCNFESNIAEGNGGAIYSIGTNSGQANHIILNSRFYANQGYAAGAIYNNGGNGGDCSPVITNCTFYENEATGAGGTGGAIYNNGDNSGNSSPTISNCIIYGNIGPYGSHVLRNIYGTPTISFSLVDVADCAALDSGEGSNVTCGDGIIYNIDPIFEDNITGNLRLQNSSPAIDAGDDSVNNEPEDLDGNIRIIHHIDLGAYETPDVILPVELVAFTALLNEGQVELAWETRSEKNNRKFTVERSTDGIHFSAVAEVPGAGNSLNTQRYKVYDNQALIGLNYYRLKSTSFEGEVAYSTIRTIEIKSNRIQIYPNPVSDELTIYFSDFDGEHLSYVVFDYLGKKVIQQHKNCNNKTIQIPEVAALTPGIYFIHLFADQNENISQSFIKL